jgi:hypothetical protein
MKRNEEVNCSLHSSLSVSIFLWVQETRSHKAVEGYVGWIRGSPLDWGQGLLENILFEKRKLASDNQPNFDSTLMTEEPKKKFLNIYI